MPVPWGWWVARFKSLIYLRGDCGRHQGWWNIATVLEGVEKEKKRFQKKKKKKLYTIYSIGIKEDKSRASPTASWRPTYAKMSLAECLMHLQAFQREDFLHFCCLSTARGNEYRNRRKRLKGWTRGKSFISRNASRNLDRAFGCNFSGNSLTQIKKNKNK